MLDSDYVYDQVNCLFAEIYFGPKKNTYFLLFNARCGPGLLHAPRSIHAIRSAAAH